MDFHKYQILIDYLSASDIATSVVSVQNSFFDPKDQIKGDIVTWAQSAKTTPGSQDLNRSQAISMSLASMAAVEHLDLRGGMKLLDTCAAPGIKSLYAYKLQPSIDLHVNDLSQNRIERMNRLFEKYELLAHVTKLDARFIDKEYELEFFDRILIDAPCSGEGIILGGDEKMLATWSPAKVKRLQQLQIKILKSSWKLLKPGGRLVYSTCTLNKNENERVIKKALGIQLSVLEQQLSLDTLPVLSTGQAWRVLPSIHSIGFFIAIIDKVDVTE